MPIEDGHGGGPGVLPGGVVPGVGAGPNVVPNTGVGAGRVFDQGPVRMRRAYNSNYGYGSNKGSYRGKYNRGGDYKHGGGNNYGRPRY